MSIDLESLSTLMLGYKSNIFSYYSWNVRTNYRRLVNLENSIAVVFMFD